MPNSASALIKKILAELYYCSILFIKKISEESIEFQVCFILGIVAVPTTASNAWSGLVRPGRTWWDTLSASNAWSGLVRPGRTWSDLVGHFVS